MTIGANSGRRIWLPLLEKLVMENEEKKGTHQDAGRKDCQANQKTGEATSPVLNKRLRK